MADERYRKLQQREAQKNDIFVAAAVVVAVKPRYLRLRVDGCIAAVRQQPEAVTVTVAVAAQEWDDYYYFARRRDCENTVEEVVEEVALFVSVLRLV